MKIKWIGPTRFIPDLGVTVEAGDSLDVPTDVTLGGEGSLWEKTKSAKPRKPKEE